MVIAIFIKEKIQLWSNIVPVCDNLQKHERL